ncbi:MAG: YkgJ family cysteine cluster protein [Polyangiaceae bacterium]
MKDAPRLPDCRDCGACCRSGAARYVPVFEIDAERLDPALRDRLTHTPEGRRYLPMVDGACALLDKTVCTIYPARPDACRALERGSSACVEALRLARS